MPKPTRSPASESAADKRLHKAIADAGITSRRQAEAWIAEGRVRVNGELATVGQKVGVQDQISIDGRRLRRSDPHEEKRVLLYKKQVGEEVSRKPAAGRRSVFRKLPRLASGRWIAIGRLDVNTSGLLLLTNDGELAQRLMHPSFEIEREYAVRIHGQVSDEMLESLQSGVMLEDGMGYFESIQAMGGRSSNQWYQVMLREGRHRLVRRLWTSQEVEVSRLMRVRYGPVMLPSGIRSGRAVDLPPELVSELYDAVGLRHGGALAKADTTRARNSRAAAVRPAGRAGARAASKAPRALRPGNKRSKP